MPSPRFVTPPRFGPIPRPSAADVFAWDADAYLVATYPGAPFLAGARCLARAWCDEHHAAGTCTPEEFAELCCEFARDPAA